MDAFSYLSVLLSIILGLGLTQILTAVGRLIRHRERVRIHWLPLVWAGVLLLIYVQVWWSMYGLRLRSDWTFLAFGIVLAQTATLYLMAAVALPEEIEPNTDLGAYFDRHHRWFFGFFLATLIISVAKDFILGGQLPDRLNLGFHALFAAGCVTGLLAQRRRYQEILAIALAIALIVYIALLFARLH
ncbi:MAG: hypothetical protein ACJ796_05945 [Gemmatimonadaceae bacterium]